MSGGGAVLRTEAGSYINGKSISRSRSLSLHDIHKSSNQETDISVSSLNSKIQRLESELSGLRDNVNKNQAVVYNNLAEQVIDKHKGIIVDTPSRCHKILALFLSIIAVIALVILVACILAVCGHLPIFLSILNAFTIGSCAALPVLVSVSIGIFLLCVICIKELLSVKVYPFVAKKPKNIAFITPQYKIHEVCEEQDTNSQQNIKTS